MNGGVDLYVLARRVLLDALDALGTHRAAAVLVGAQAVYLRVGDASLAVAPYTTDGDLLIDPHRLAEVPPLEQGLQQAGFQPSGRDSVGVWVAARGKTGAEITIDLLVPATLAAGGGRRAARLRGHEAKAARITAGIEGAVVDANEMEIKALEPTDARAFALRVVGPAALVVAKVHKIADRSGTDRSQDKDALDVPRLLRGTSSDDMAARFGALLGDARSSETAKHALALLRDQFVTPPRVGMRMMLRAVGVLEDHGAVQASCEALVEELLTGTEL